MRLAKKYGSDKEAVLAYINELAEEKERIYTQAEEKGWARPAVEKKGEKPPETQGPEQEEKTFRNLSHMERDELKQFARDNDLKIKRANQLGWFDLLREVQGAYNKKQGLTVVDVIESPGIAVRNFKPGDPVAWEGGNGKEEGERMFGYVAEIKDENRRTGNLTISEKKGGNGSWLVPANKMVKVPETLTKEEKKPKISEEETKDDERKPETTKTDQAGADRPGSPGEGAGFQEPPAPPVTELSAGDRGPGVEPAQGTEGEAGTGDQAGDLTKDHSEKGGTTRPGSDRGGRAGDRGTARQPGGPGGGTGTASGGGRTEDSGVGGQPGRPPADTLAEEDRDHRIEASDVLFPAGPETKIQTNIKAVRLYKKLVAEDRNPTPEEKKKLAQYVGWGQFAQKVFNLKPYKAYLDAVARDPEVKRKPEDFLYGTDLTKYLDWEKRYGRHLHPDLGGVLTPEEWDSAERSTLNAHYTSKDAITAMWQAVEHLGFEQGVIVEPSAGVGHFFGLMPEKIHKKSVLMGIELDEITGGILQKLYPQADIQVTGFEKALGVPDNSVDLVISNFPFGNYSVYDKKHKDYTGWSIHNYFFARAIDAVRPGGLVMGITSHWTLDSKTGGPMREYWARKADLVGAVRLPNNAFSKDAGTEVTTDILVFRKKDGTGHGLGRNFRVVREVAAGDKTAEVNEYFADHPEMVLGRHSLKGKMHGRQAAEEEYTVEPVFGRDALQENLAKAFTALPSNIYGEGQGKDAAERVRAEEGQTDGSLVESDDGKIYMVEEGLLKEPMMFDSKGNYVKAINTKARERRVRDYLALKAAAKKQIDRELSEDATDEEIETLRAELNRRYDRFYKNNKALNSVANGFLRKIDIEFPIMDALETEARENISFKVPKGQKNAGEQRFKFKYTYTKGPILQKRALYPFREPERAETVEDAIALSRVYRGGVSTRYLGKLLGRDPEEVRQEILERELVYLDPGTGVLEAPDRYLSGHVRKKLDIARDRAKEDKTFEANVKALEKVQPEPLDIAFIEFRLGTAWMPPEAVQDFLRDVIGVEAEVVNVRTQEETHWAVRVSDGERSARNVETWGVSWERINGGTGVRTGTDLVERALNLRRPEIRDPRYNDKGDPSGSVLNAKATLQARNKTDELQFEFLQYIRKHDTWGQKCADIYNDIARGWRRRETPTPDIERFPGASRAVKLRDLQKRGVARALQDSTLLAYGVGTGKTFTFISLAMEMRRIGTARKPMIVVDGATVDQYARDFKALYPQAKVLVPGDKMRTGKNRTRLLAQIAMGDWDAVVIPDSFFDRIPNDPARAQAFIEESLAGLRAALSKARSNAPGNSEREIERDPTVKQLRRQLENKEAKLEKLLDRETDPAMPFEKMGVDALLVDEAHRYKRGEFYTQMGNIKGIDHGASQRSAGLLMKARYVQEKTGGKNVVLATGTPISNTTAELWTLLRYIRPQLLKEFHCELFDDFAAMFGESQVQTEQTADGTFKQVERFNKYKNGTDLLTMFFEATDVALTQWADLNLPEMEGGQVQSVVVERSEAMAGFIEELKSAMEWYESLAGPGKLDYGYIPVSVYTLARQGAVDLRLVDPERYGDDPGSKVNVMLRKVHEIWKETAKDRSTQAIFCDLHHDPSKTFDLYKDMKEKLVKMGIPEEEIIIYRDADSDAKRDAVKDLLRLGDARVVIGSSTKLGVGVNIQDKLIAAHHVDPPQLPKDIEQRNGRIVREKNENPVVRVYAYGVKDTLDSVLYDRLLKKQFFIDQILSGDIEGRTFEEPSSESLMSFAEMQAAFAGNPLLYEKNEIDARVRELRIMEQQHQVRVSKARQEARWLKEKVIPGYEKDLVKARSRAKRFAKLFPESKYAEATYEGKVLDRKDFIEALTEARVAMGKALAKKFKGMTVVDFHHEDAMGRNREMFAEAEIGGLTVKFDIEVHISDWNLRYYDNKKTAKHKLKLEELEPTLSYSVHDGGKFVWGREIGTPDGFTTSFQAQLKNVQALPGDIEKTLAVKKKDLAEHEQNINQPFAAADELREKRQRKDEIDRELEETSAQAREEERGDQAAPARPAPDSPLGRIMDRAAYRRSLKDQGLSDAAIRRRMKNYVPGRAWAAAPAAEEEPWRRDPSSVYWTSLRDGWKPIPDAARVETIPGVETFAYKDEITGKWSVVEARTGLAVGGGQDTRKDAIRAFMEGVGRAGGPEVLEETIKTHLADNEESPYITGELPENLYEKTSLRPAPEARETYRPNKAQLKNARDLAKLVPKWLEEAGAHPSVIERIRVEFKPFIDLTGKNIDRTVEEWRKDGRSVETILGATTVRELEAVMELALHVPSLRDLEKTVLHEYFHVAARWVLPGEAYQKLIRHYGTEERTADAFADFIKGRKRTFIPGTTSWVRRQWLRIKRFLTRLRNWLDGKGFARPQDFFGPLSVGAYRPHFASGTTAQQTFPQMKFRGEPGRPKPFYSHLVRTLEQAPPDMPRKAQSLKKWLERRQVKPDELKWMDIDGWIETNQDKEGKIDRKALLEYVRAHEIRVEEVVKDVDAREFPDWEEVESQKAALSVMGIAAEVYESEDGYVVSLYDRKSSKHIPPEELDGVALEAYDRLINAVFGVEGSEEGGGLALYGPSTGYDVNVPGGEEYREILFRWDPPMPGFVPEPTDRLPPNHTMETVQENEWTGQRDVVILDADGRFVTERTGTRATDEEIVRRFMEARNEDARMMARRKASYQSTHWEEKNVLLHARVDERRDSSGRKIGFIQEIQSDWLQDAAKGKAVPDAPFKDTWHEFALKRLIRWAAEEGFDMLAWTTGRQQIERYNLRKHIDEIEWVKQGGPKFHDLPKKNRDYYTIYAKKDGGSVLSRADLKPEDLAGAVGEGMAKKIVAASRNKDSGTLSGLDLQIGGKGMEVFYDEKLPGFARKYVKKWGAKVERIEVETGYAQRPVYEGPTFSLEAFRRMIAEKRFKDSLGWVADGVEIYMSAHYATFKDAIAAMGTTWLAEALGGKMIYPQLTEPVHAVPVTEAMRESVLFEGQTYFKLAEPESGPETARDLEENRTFVNKLFETGDLGRHRISTAAAKLQEEVQRLAGKASRRKFTLGFAYNKELKRSRASDELDQAMMIYRDVQAAPEKIDEFRAWANGALADEKTKAETKLEIKGMLKILDRVETLTDEQKAFAMDRMGDAFEGMYDVASRAGLVKSHRDFYVRRLWRLPEGKEGDFFSSGTGHGFKTFTTAKLERKFDTILDGFMAGYRLRVSGLTNSWKEYASEIATILSNKAFISRGVKTKDINGNALFSTKKLSGYAPLKAKGFEVWRWAGEASAEVHLEEKEALVIDTYGRKFFATPPERVPARFIVSPPEGKKGRVPRGFFTREEAEAFAEEQGWTDIKEEPPVDVSTLFEKQRLYAPADLAEQINKVTATDRWFWQTPGARALLRLNAGLKSYILMSSFFHHLAGSRSWIFGVHHGWKGVSPIKAYKDGLRKIHDLHPLIDLGVKNGLTLGDMQDWSEWQLREEKGLTESLVKKLGMERAAALIEKGKFKREGFADSLFKKFFAGLKAEAFCVEYAHELQKAREKFNAGRGPAPNEGLIAEQTARLINADFGGLHTKRMGRNPTLQKTARLLLLAPDWTESNFRTVTGMIPGLNKKIGNLIGDVPPPKGMEEIYRKFWTRVMLRIAVGTIIAQLLMSNKDEREEFYEEQMRSNRWNKFRWTEIEVTKLYHMLGIDTEGTKKTFSLGGHFFDPLKLLDPWRLVKGKGSPLTRALGALGGTDWADRPFTGVRELAETGKTVKKSPYMPKEQFYNRLPSVVVNQVVNMQPIQVGHFIKLLQGEEDALTALMHSAGAATHTAWPPRITTPIVKRKSGPDPVYEEIEAMMKAGVLAMGPPSRYTQMAGVSYKMSREQYEEYLSRSSAAARRKLAPLVTSRRWEQWDDAKKRRIVEGTLRNARKRARGRIRRQIVREARREAS